MNNIDKLIIKNKRYKYYRAPTIDDISVMPSERVVRIIVGAYTYYPRVPTGSAIFKHSNIISKLAETFNMTQNIDDLNQICNLLNFNIKTLFTRGYKKGLFTEEGIKFIRKLYIEINKIICDIIKSINKIQDLELDIAPIHPQVSSIYAVSNTHLSGLQKESRYLKNLLRVNGEDV